MPQSPGSALQQRVIVLEADIMRHLNRVQELARTARARTEDWRAIRAHLRTAIQLVQELIDFVPGEDLINGNGHGHGNGPGRREPE